MSGKVLTWVGAVLVVVVGVWVATSGYVPNPIQKKSA